MTTGGDDPNFSYTDDSVVARISVDVPPGAVTSLAEVSQQTHTLRTEMEALARAQGDWLNYLQSLPEIAQQAAQAQQNLITQLERTAYIQNELGGQSNNVGMTTGEAGGAASPQQPSGGGYSTSAPAGYVNPFMGMSSGMGVAQTQQYMSGMAQNDPRMYANMMAQRGMSVNPFQMGLVGQSQTSAGAGAQAILGSVQTTQGLGGPPPGSTVPQNSNAQRNSGAPPNPNQGGQSSQAPPQQASLLDSVINETQQTPGRGVFGLGVGATRGAANWMSQNAAGGGGSGGGGGGGMGAMAGLMGKAGSIGTAMIGANQLAQNMGQKFIGYEQLGAETGGGAATGMKAEAEARIMAINPFISTEQARQVMQKAMSAGYRGNQADTVQDMMLGNFRKFGMDFNSTMELVEGSVRKTSSSGAEFKENMDALGGGLDLLKKGVSEGNGMSMSGSVQNLKDVSAVMAPQGLDTKGVTQMAAFNQQAFGNNPTLTTTGFQDKLAGLGNDQSMMALVGAQHGVTGQANTLVARMQQRGINPGEALMETLQTMAKRFKQGSPDDDIAAVGRFQSYLQGKGMPIDQPEAMELYKQLTGSQNVSSDTRKKIAKMVPGDQMGEGETPGKSIASRIGGALSYGFSTKSARNPIDFVKDMGTILGGGDATPGAKSAQAAAGALVGAPTAAEAAAAYRASDKSNPNAYIAPTTSAEAQARVSGELRVVVDQAGRVSAPATVQLSGNQTAANAGQGARKNDVPPGETAKSGR